MRTNQTPHYPQQWFINTRFKPGSFWAKKRDMMSTTGISNQLENMKKTGRYDAFKLHWMPVYDDEANDWPVAKHCFWDSDVAKWIEGACYFLKQQDNPEVRAAVFELTDMIANAQQSDGYLNVHFTVVDPNGRWKNLRDQHELYNAGHLIEAAIAYERVFAKGRFWDAIIKYADYLAAKFGDKEGQMRGYPGHPEIEQALLRLWDRTHQTRYLELARFFLTERGNPRGVEGRHYYDYEAERRGEGLHEVADAVPHHRSYWYAQAHAPLVEQPTIEGHSVRAAYLLTGLADLVRVHKVEGLALDDSYHNTVYRLWDNMVDKKMYLTGGIGAMKQWEGFGIDYFLPQGTDEGGCYAETCASIGVMMWANRLLDIERDGRYGDIMELQLYNAVLTGVALDGKSWAYVNQLTSSGTDPSRRSEWFDVSCCPPNVLRLLGSLGGYFYTPSTYADELCLNIHMYADMEITEDGGSFDLPKEKRQVKVAMKTSWPLDGKVVFNVAFTEAVQLKIYYRIPGWASGDGLVEIAGYRPKVENGYALLDTAFLRNNSSFVLDFPMEPRMVSPHPFIGQSTIAVQRGPIVYCVEDVDNEWVEDHFKRTYVSATPASIRQSRRHDDRTGEEYVAISVDYHEPTQLDISSTVSNGPGHRSFDDIIFRKCLKGTRTLNYIPYYFRSNRGGRGHMRVGLKSLDGIQH